MTNGTDITVTAERVATIERCRPPNNYFDVTLIERIAEALWQLGAGFPSVSRGSPGVCFSPPSFQSVHYIRRSRRALYCRDGDDVDRCGLSERREF